MRRSTRFAAALGAAVLVACSSQPPAPVDEQLYQFTAADKAFLDRFSLQRLPPKPAAASNAVADNPAAAALGHSLFFDTRISANGEVSCASCHQPDKYFTDGLALSTGLGTTSRGAPSLPPAVYSQWLYWDGRKDSLWSQALAPIEHPDEQGLTRVELVHQIVEHYAERYQALFGPLPDVSDLPPSAGPQGSQSQVESWSVLTESQREEVNRVFANVGKTLMAYQRRLELQPSRFDKFVDQLSSEAPLSALAATFSSDEVAGLRLFMGQGDCASCHNGPMFSNAEFHNVGVPERTPEQVDLGRYAAIEQLLADDFTCLSEFSDAPPDACEEIRFLKRQGPELVGAFKTPSLRNIAATAPYMHAGQFQSLAEVVAHYNAPRPPFYDREQHPNRPHFDILPLNLTPEEQGQLVAFLNTLTSPLPEDGPSSRWWRAPQ